MQREEIESLPLSFFPVSKKEKSKIQTWLKKSHVQPFFYGDGLKNTLRNLDLFVKGIHCNGEYCFQHYVAYIGKKPFGFLMTSVVEGPYDAEDEYRKWFEEGKETITLDLLIGEEKYLGKGLGSRMIRKFLEEVFLHTVSTVLIDPEEKNEKAIHLYEKVGFKKVGQFFPKHNPKIVHYMMRLRKEEFNAKEI